MHDHRDMKKEKAWTNEWGEKYDMYMYDSDEEMWTWMNIEYEWHMPIMNYWLIILNGMN